MILLDYRDKRPIYEQMVEKLERLIASGGLEQGSKMPSVRSLAVDLAVNPNTVQRAYTLLEQEGYLYTVTGRGSFVAPEREWRDGQLRRVLAEWMSMTRRARDAGLSQKVLQEQLAAVYSREGTKETDTDLQMSERSDDDRRLCAGRGDVEQNLGGNHDRSNQSAEKL